MKYTPSPIPPNFKPEVRSWLADELRKISEAFDSVERLSLNSRAAEPDRYIDGQVVYADGANWDPGSGEGVYGRYNALWNKLGFDPTADQTISGVWTFALPDSLDTMIISKDPGLNAPVLTLQHNFSGGNRLLLECKKTPSTWVFRVDNEGDVQALGAIGVGNGFSLSYTLESQYVSFMNAGKNLGLWFGTSTSTHLKRGGSFFGVRPSVSRDTLLANQAFDDVTVRRDWDGQSSYTVSGAMLKFDLDIINATSDTTDFIDCQNTAASMFRVDQDGSVFINEKAAANADVAGRGQLWVKNATPCELWFTDDAGTDTQIV